MAGRQSRVVMIIELHQDSPMATQPECNVTLYRHQLTLLKRARDLETSPIDLNDERITHPTVNSTMRVLDRNATIRAASAFAHAASTAAAFSAAAATPASPPYSSSVLRTSIGIIGDKVGAGKSYVILALALQTRNARLAAAAAAAAAGYEIRCELVWNKNQAQYGALSAQYKQKHEPFYYCHKSGKAPRWFGPTNEVTVWDCDRASVNEHHPTQKPPELIARAIRNSSEPKQVVCDWFLGSGTTMVAAEQLDRTCYGIEIEPKYVAVALQRMKDMGLEPRLI